MKDLLLEGILRLRLGGLFSGELISGGGGGGGGAYDRNFTVFSKAKRCLHISSIPEVAV